MRQVATHSELHYRPDIDGLRALAVLAVIGFHAVPEYVPGGFVGVDVFFVISGYLISTIILKQLSKSAFTFTGFYARRARRILPALVVVLASCLLVGFWVLLPEEFENLGKHAAAAAAFAANLSFWHDSGYFAPAAELEPLLHLWSLGIEEQFYLVWPVLLLLAWRRKLNIAWLILALSVASFLLNLVLVSRNPANSFYLPLPRSWELGLGCLLASIESRARQQGARHVAVHEALPRTIAMFLPWVGMALIGLSVFLFNRTTVFPGAAALLPTIGTVCLIAAPRGSWFNEKVLAHRVLVFIGLISYTLYLWHWPILSFMAILNSGKPPLHMRLAGVALALILAVVTFEMIELRLRWLPRLWGAKVGRALVGTTLAVGLLGFMVFVAEGIAQRFSGNVVSVKQGPKTDPLCRSSVPEAKDVNYCRRTTGVSPEVVFLGDSQAQAVYEGVVSVLGPEKPMLLLGRGGCPPVLNVPESPHVYPSNKVRAECNAAWSMFVDYVGKTRPDVVVLVGNGAHFFPKSDEKPDGSPPATAEDVYAFQVGLSSLVDQLQRYSRVIYLLEIPTFESPPTCLLRPVKLPGSTCNPQVPREGLTQKRSTYIDSVFDVQRQHADLIVVDAIPSLCGSANCSQVDRRGRLLYRDKAHLSPAGGRRLAQGSGLSNVITDATRVYRR